MYSSLRCCSNKHENCLVDIHHFYKEDNFVTLSLFLAQKYPSKKGLILKEKDVLTLEQLHLF